LAVPSKNCEYFPDFDIALQVEKMFLGQRDATSATGIPATDYLTAKDDLDLNLIELIKTRNAAAAPSLAEEKAVDETPVPVQSVEEPGEPMEEESELTEQRAMTAAEEAVRKEEEEAAARRAAELSAKREEEARIAAEIAAKEEEARIAAELVAKEEEARVAAELAAKEWEKGEEEARVAEELAAKEWEKAEDDAINDDDFGDDW